MVFSRLVSVCFVALGLLYPGAAAGGRHTQQPVRVTRPKAIETLMARIRELKKTPQRTMQDDAADKSKRQTNNAACAFALMQVTNFLGRIAFQIKALGELCPKASHPDQTGYATPLKGCIVSSMSLITSFSQIAAGLSAAATKCGEEANFKAMCAAPIAAIFSPTTVFVSASTVASAACAKGIGKLSEEQEEEIKEFEEALDPDRRLDDDDKEWDAEDRKWEIGACTLDSTSAVMALGQLALGFNAATKNCPAISGHSLQEKVSTAVCTADAGFTFFSISRLVAFLALAVNHCTPLGHNEAACVASGSALAAACYSTAMNGAAMYVNCHIGAEHKEDILDGTSKLLKPKLLRPFSRRLGKNESIHTLARLNQRSTLNGLIEELAKESAFGKAEDLWLSMGYNLSDPRAAWLKEAPEAAAVIRKGRQMIKDLQTVREEPSEELLASGPVEALLSDVPEVRIVPQDDASALNCSELGVAYNLDLPDHAASLEQGVAACQARCARVAGCAHFSYWPPKNHCHLHGILADPLPGRPPWISGPPGCHEPQVSEATRRTLERKRTCYHPHAVYEPRDTLTEPRPAASIEECQRRCQQTEACAHFVYSGLDGECSLADSSAVKLQPVLYNVAGPRHCPGAPMAVTSLAGVVSLFSSFRAQYAAKDQLIGAVSALSCVVLVLWAIRAASRRVYRSIVQNEQALELE